MILAGIIDRLADERIRLSCARSAKNGRIWMSLLSCQLASVRSLSEMSTFLALAPPSGARKCNRTLRSNAANGPDWFLCRANSITLNDFVGID